MNETLDLDSTSEVDREELNGGERKSDWKDARKMKRANEGDWRETDPLMPIAQKNESAGAGMQPTLEDGAD